MDRHERGRAAERLARDVLLEHGLEALDANWRRRVGELDLIMREPLDGTIVFVEVRYRGRSALGDALESVDRAKRMRLRRAALAWLQRHADPDAPARIDVVAIGPAPTDDGAPARPVPAPPAHRPAARDRDAGSVPPSRTPCRHDDVPARPERLVAEREGQRIEWVVDAVGDDG